MDGVLCSPYHSEFKSAWNGQSLGLSSALVNSGFAKDMAFLLLCLAAVCGRQRLGSELTSCGSVKNEKCIKIRSDMGTQTPITQSR